MEPAKSQYQLFLARSPTFKYFASGPKWLDPLLESLCPHSTIPVWRSTPVPLHSYRWTRALPGTEGFHRVRIFLFVVSRSLPHWLEAQSMSEGWQKMRSTGWSVNTSVYLAVFQTLWSNQGAGVGGGDGGGVILDWNFHDDNGLFLLSTLCWLWVLAR